MVLIDTSVWVSLYRKGDHPIGQMLWSLVASNQAALCGQVIVEYVGGFRKQTERTKAQTALGSFPFLDTTEDAYYIASELLAQHPGLGPGDVIIAATAISHRAALLSLDRDFHKIKHPHLKLV